MVSKPILVISFSGGETSAYMAFWIITNLSNKYTIICIFANTGEENEATLEFVKMCDEHFGLNVIWVECVTNPSLREGVSAKVVTFDTASRNGEPFEASIAKHGIPNVNFPHCSRELKAYTIKAYMRQLGVKEYYTAIGIRSDEFDRIADNYIDERKVYPFIEGFHLPCGTKGIRVTKPHVNVFWKNMPFRLALKGYQGNCKVCWKKSLRKLLTIAKETPEAFDNFKKWEEKYGNYIPESRVNKLKNMQLPVRFFRNNLSVDDIMRLSKHFFEPAIDDSQNYYVQTSLFGYELDTSNGCEEACGT